MGQTFRVKVSRMMALKHLRARMLNLIPVVAVPTSPSYDLAQARLRAVDVIDGMIKNFKWR